jgi:hypothetical protein
MEKPWKNGVLKLVLNGGNSVFLIIKAFMEFPTFEFYFSVSSHCILHGYRAARLGFGSRIWMQKVRRQ